MSSNLKTDRQVLLSTLRNRVIAACSQSDDPIAVGHLIDGLLEAAVFDAKACPEFFTTAQLTHRYSKSRKWVERLPIKRLRMQGAVMYAVADVLAYEAKAAEGTLGAQ